MGNTLGAQPEDEEENFDVEVVSNKEEEKNNQLNSKIDQNSYNIKKSIDQMEEDKSDKINEETIKEYQRQLEVAFSSYPTSLNDNPVAMPGFTATYTPKEYRIKKEKKVYFGKKGKDFMITILG